MVYGRKVHSTLNQAILQIINDEGFSHQPVLQINRKIYER